MKKGGRPRYDVWPEVHIRPVPDDPGKYEMQASLGYQRRDVRDDSINTEDSTIRIPIVQAKIGEEREAKFGIPATSNGAFAKLRIDNIGGGSIRASYRIEVVEDRQNYIVEGTVELDNMREEMF